MDAKHKVEIVPPKTQRIDWLVRQCCRFLGPDYEDEALQSGLIGFLKLTAEIEALRLNEAENRAENDLTA